MLNDSNQISTDLDYETFKREVRTTYGIDLNSYKRQQMERRLRANMVRCGATTLRQYFGMLKTNQSLADEFLDRLTINVSELFRNPEQFDVLRTKILPGLLERKQPLSIWSAGCSYGAEPYSLAILLDELDPTGRHKIFATDLDDKMLARAREGVFEENETHCVTKQRLLTYFDRSGSSYTSKPVLRNKITFAKHNLLEDKFRSGFELIVCRNVVIYFTEEAKFELYKRFFESLRPGGWLFIGGTERISGHTEIGFENRIPFFYRKPEMS